MSHETEIDNLLGIFVNEDSYYPMFQKLGANIASKNPAFKEAFDSALLFHPHEINPAPTQDQQKINKELRLELVRQIKHHLIDFESKTYGEIFKLFKSVDQMRDEIRKFEGRQEEVNFDGLISDVEKKADDFTNNFLDFSK